MLWNREALGWFGTFVIRDMLCETRNTTCSDRKFSPSYCQNVEFISVINCFFFLYFIGKDINYKMRT